MAIVLFLLNVVGISLSGVMAPGPVTAATLTHGARSRWAGVWMAFGHGVIEIPLIYAIMLGFSGLIKSDGFKIVVGLVGGAFLLWMAVGMFRQSRHVNPLQAASTGAGPFATGFALSAGNPYFLFWWATVGLNMTIRAREFGWLAFALFALVHWLCDLVWLTILSLGAFHGRTWLGDRNQRIILIGCGAAMLLFAFKFIRDAMQLWIL